MKEKLLLDENIPRGVRKLLLQKGLDAKSVLETARGLRNSDIAHMAIKERRIILTMDSDFLKFERQLQRMIRIILVKAHPVSTAKIAEILDRNLSMCLKLIKRKRIIVLTQEGIA